MLVQLFTVSTLYIRVPFLVQRSIIHINRQQISAPKHYFKTGLNISNILTEYWPLFKKMWILNQYDPPDHDHDGRPLLVFYFLEGLSPHKIRLQGNDP